jgi:hypothetical protein
MVVKKNAGPEILDITMRLAGLEPAALGLGKRVSLFSCPTLNPLKASKTLL